MEQQANTKQNDLQKEHYDRFYQSEESVELVTRDFKNTFEENFIEQCGLLPEHRALEVGCGNGMLTQRLLDRCGHVIALDLSDHGFERIKNEAEGKKAQLELIVSDLDQYLAKGDGGSFDRIVGSGILHHLPDLKQSFRLMHAALKPGGQICFGPEPNASGLYGPTWRFLAPPVYRMMRGNFDWEVEKGTLSITYRGLNQMLSRAGFVNVQIRPYQVIPHFKLSWLRDVDRNLIGRTSLGRFAMYVSVFADKRK